jgi:hypothetical protein
LDAETDCKDMKDEIDQLEKKKEKKVMLKEKLEKR